MYQNWILGHQVELAEMLNGRERRALAQRRLLEIYQKTLICFTLNIAGPVKVFPLSEEAFSIGRKRISDALEQADMHVLEEEILPCSYGMEAYWVVQEDALEVKKVLTEVEEETPLGRLFDIDVLWSNGSKVSRQDIGYPPRTCIICGEPASDCAGGRVHSVDALQKKTVEIIAGEIQRIGVSAEMAGRICRMAMLHEVYTTPKPGLVDRNNTGAHQDMDVELFEKSARILEPYFVRCVEMGAKRHDLPANSLLSDLRPLGIQAESDMFSVTKGVNTHKGMIFSLGILCGALGQLLGKGEKPDTAALCQRAGEIAYPALEKDLAGMKESAAQTAGERQYALWGISGIRGEAASGFLSVQKYSLPILQKELAAGSALYRAGSVALLYLIAHVVDSNVISRSDYQTQQKLQEQVGILLKKEPSPSEDAILELDRLFTEKNVSPGGCADLLAISYFLLFLEELL
ncbi:triphosphoribosyl-dephospho-CoA synthase CitG [Hominifimenecus sp. rT4P-3]|uniref:triphosphoribosyl-dephospho-CoA synthase CitG n=1 Tax=Hominifimenecus sp. rT4P-3 TaxID=3242979 RepID=UPI003DA307C1